MKTNLFACFIALLIVLSVQIENKKDNELKNCYPFCFPLFVKNLAFEMFRAALAFGRGFGLRQRKRNAARFGAKLFFRNFVFG